MVTGSDNTGVSSDSANKPDVNALIAMVDYILPEVQGLSIIATVLLHLARSELVTCVHCQSGDVLEFKKIQ